jgi:hypothetical protein
VNNKPNATGTASWARPQPPHISQAWVCPKDGYYVPQYAIVVVNLGEWELGVRTLQTNRRCQGGDLTLVSGSILVRQALNTDARSPGSSSCPSISGEVGGETYTTQSLLPTGAKHLLIIFSCLFNGCQLRICETAGSFTRWIRPLLLHLF